MEKRAYESSIYYIIKRQVEVSHDVSLEGLEILILIRENQRKKRSIPSILYKVF
jgi:hypothetical protein